MTLVALVLIQACWELVSTLLALPGKVLKKCAVVVHDGMPFLVQLVVQIF